MTPQPSDSQSKQGYFIIFAALVLSVAVYAGMCFFIAQNPKGQPVSPALPAIRPFVIALAVAALVASLGWLRFRIDGKIGGAGRPVQITPGQFQTDSIIALALAEACVILGLLLFFLGAPLGEFARFAFGTLFVDFAFILPRARAFWARQDR